MQSVADGFADDAEVAVAQVEEELFQRAADFDPRVPPGTASVEALFVIHVVDDITRVLQRTVELEALHGQDFAQAAWRRLRTS